MSQPAPQPKPDCGRIKGAAFREFVASVEKDWGAEALTQVVIKLSPDDQRSYLVARPALGLLAGTWYPADLVHRFLDQLIDGLSEPELERMARQGAEYTMQTNLRGVYRSLFGILVSPRIYAAGMQQLWNMHYDSGRVAHAFPTAHSHQAIITDWRGHHPFVCRLNVASAYPIYGAMHCQDVFARLDACVSKGDPHCAYHIEWSKR